VAALNESLVEGLNLVSTKEKDPQQSAIIALEVEAAMAKQLTRIRSMFLEMTASK
jgi:hypothetical protein